MSLPPEAIAAGARVLVVAPSARQAPRGGAWSPALFAGSELTPVWVSTPADARAQLSSAAIDAVVVDAVQSEGAALELVSALARQRPDAPVIFALGGESVVEEAALAAGAADVIRAYPLEAAEVLVAVRRALHLAHGEAPDGAPVAADPLLGEAKSMQRLRELIARAGPGTATILVRGETGTGKELVARACHAASDRRLGPMVTLHCAALPDTLLEAELFGHEKGAFTGATARKLGRIERAHRGTLFLDEIGDVPLHIQVKLLRVLQERSFERLGGVDPIHVDVRFVAATHRDLDAMVTRGEFREDLFYRLNVLPLWVPPLRARRHDIELLAQHFCDVFARAGGRGPMRFSSAALAVLRAQRWPGNVRQLQNFVERVIVLGRGDGRGATIEADEVNAELDGRTPFETEASEASEAAHRSLASIPPVSTPGADLLSLGEEVRRAERGALERALHHAAGNRSKAARLLGVSRATLYNKLKEHGL